MVRRLIRRHLKPPQLVVLSFTLVIAAGTALLSLPAATRAGEPLPVVDAFFTAVSATCVTGLAVVDTGSVFSTFGQLVILACIQVGGLGLMTFTTVLLTVFGRRLAIADRVIIQESFHHTPTGKITTIIKYIVVATFAVEASGAAMLTIHWLRAGRYATFGETLYSAVFHSISAFCNAGFSLHADSLTGFRGDFVSLAVFSALIIVGGLGFLVGLDLKEYVQLRWLRRLWSAETQARVLALGRRPRLSVHTKFVLITTGLLLAVGTVSFYLLERGGTLAGMTTAEAWANAWFLSVTPRTAGFNTVDYAQLGGAGLLCTMVLMFIGASPGSTGGGVKTSTLALLVAYSVARWRGHARLHAFNRTIPGDSIDRASAVVVAALALLIVASSALMATETAGDTAEQSRREFLPVLFEAVSAFGTVGLSVGQTPILTAPGKLIVAALMFMGRTGPLTLALAISLRRPRAQYRYAEENIMIG
jgi:trk system potassium uptake protein